MRIAVRFPRREWPGERERIGYQELYVRFPTFSGERVLDIGCGSDPFPYATVLFDRYLVQEYRGETLVTKGKPFYLGDIHQLPFGDKCFDFVYCSHVVQCVEDPIRACSEIMRVGKRGYIETPTLGKDALFAWAQDLQKWHVVAVDRNLCFFEYSPGQLKGIRSSIWREVISSKWDHPLQAAFYENQDVFNVMFSWSENFAVLVFHLDGIVEALNSKVKYRDTLLP